MTSPVNDPSAPATGAKTTSRWEDFIDIFYAPSSVYARRQHDSPWPTIWIVTVVLLVISVATFNAVSPALETEVRHQMAASMAKNPQMTQALMDRSVGFTLMAARFGAIATPIGIMIAALILWGLSKLFDAKQDYRGSLVIVSFAFIADVVKSLVTGAQAMVMDSTTLTTPYMLSVGPVRFVDRTSLSPYLLAIYTRLDLFTIWYSVLLGIGLHVVGKVSKNQAISFAVVHWILITCLALIGAARQVAAAG